MYLSLRDTVSGRVFDFLNDEGMQCSHTHEGLILLMNSLALYREEGRALFPEVFIFDSLEPVLRMLPFSEHVSIGVGPKSAATMSAALKKCAPLAQEGWSIYILRDGDLFKFGLFRSGENVLSVRPADHLINHGTPEVPALFVHQIADNTVELKGVNGGALVVSFGAARVSAISPVEAQAALVSSIVADVANEVKEQTAAFYDSILSRVVKAGHGTLAVVVKHTKRSQLKIFSDCITLDPPVSATLPIMELLKSNSCYANTLLQSKSALISGMLLSDGITAFASDGSVRAYKIFIKHTKSKTNPNSGGARRRTFDILQSRVGRDLTCAFMQSQDGATDYKK
ncbi:MAG TPA: hypothetical protein VHY84_03845 [Bryobacteraceae bacterium]|jgi:hypothetical protein|nr:hypothetical protein [Bryobacteraceae bacterium]